MPDLVPEDYRTVRVDPDDMLPPPPPDKAWIYREAVEVLARRHIHHCLRDRHGLNLDRTLNGAAMRDVQARVAEIADEIGNPGRGDFEAAYDVLQHGVGVES